MDSTIYVIQAWHYAQWDVLEEDEDGFATSTEILDEDDCNMVLVGVRASLEGAEALAVQYRDGQRVRRDGDDVRTDPICSINVWKASLNGPPGGGEWVKTVPLRS